MLYVIQVRAGSENKTIREISNKVTVNAYSDVYTPLREERIKVQGKWVTKRKILFPGYVFVESDDIGEFHNQLKLVPGYTKIIGDDKAPISVTEDEMALIKKLINNRSVMEVSEGEIVGTEVRIKYGPLKGLEGLIVKINRHKRQAWLQTEMFGRRQVIEVGVEITSKI